MLKTPLSPCLLHYTYTRRSNVMIERFPAKITRFQANHDKANQVIGF